MDGSKMRTPGKQGYIPSTLCEIPSNTPAGTASTDDEIVQHKIFLLAISIHLYQTNFERKSISKATIRKQTAPDKPLKHKTHSASRTFTFHHKKSTSPTVSSKKVKPNNTPYIHKPIYKSTPAGRPNLHSSLVRCRKAPYGCSGNGLSSFSF